MNKYRVTIGETVLYQVEVRAEREGDATEKAESMIINAPDRDKYCIGCQDRAATEIVLLPVAESAKAEVTLTLRIGLKRLRKQLKWLYKQPQNKHALGLIGLIEAIQDQIDPPDNLVSKE